MGLSGGLASNGTQGGHVSASVVTDASGSPKGIDSTGVADTNVLAYDIASGRFKPTADTGWVNVKTAVYGAKGDGTTDDTAAINAACTAARALANAHGVGHVYLPAGTYRVTGPIDCHNCLLQGNGWDSTSIKYGDTGVAAYKMPALASGNWVDAPTVTLFSTTGGSLGNGTYAYQIAARCRNGITIVSPETTFTISNGLTANQIQVAWGANPYAIMGYTVYGRIVNSGAGTTLSGAITAATSSIQVAAIPTLAPQTASALTGIAGHIQLSTGEVVGYTAVSGSGPFTLTCSDSAGNLLRGLNMTAASASNGSAVTFLKGALMSTYGSSTPSRSNNGNSNQATTFVDTGANVPLEFPPTTDSTSCAKLRVLDMAGGSPSLANPAGAPTVLDSGSTQGTGDGSTGNGFPNSSQTYTFTWLGVPSGETLASPSAAVTPTLGHGINVTWPAAPSDTVGVKIYRGASLVQIIALDQNGNNSSGNKTWLDANVATVAGTAPVSNTTGGLGVEPCGPGHLPNATVNSGTAVVDLDVSGSIPGSYQTGDYRALSFPRPIGIRMAGNTEVRRVKAGALASLYAGIEIYVDHERVLDYDGGGAYYGIYFSDPTGSGGDQTIENAQLAGCKWAGIAFAPTQSSNSLLKRIHFGGIFGVYREECAGVAGAATVSGSHMITTQFESCGNAVCFVASPRKGYYSIAGAVQSVNGIGATWSANMDGAAATGVGFPPGLSPVSLQDSSGRQIGRRGFMFDMGADKAGQFQPGSGRNPSLFSWHSSDSGPTHTWQGAINVAQGAAFVNTSGGDAPLDLTLAIQRANNDGVGISAVQATPIANAQGDAARTITNLGSDCRLCPNSKGSLSQPTSPAAAGAAGGSLTAGTYGYVVAALADVLVQNLNAPTIASVVQSSLAGNVPATTNFYVVTAVNTNGETTKSVEVSLTTAATGQNKITINQVMGAASYNVYRSTVSGTYTTPALIGNVVASGSSSQVSLTDNLAAPTTGAPPGSNGAVFYYWGGQSHATAEVKATIDGSTQQSVIVTWAAPATNNLNQGYVIFGRGNGISSALKKIVAVVPGSGSTSWTDTGAVTPGTNFSANGTVKTLALTRNPAFQTSSTTGSALQSDYANSTLAGNGDLMQWDTSNGGNRWLNAGFAPSGIAACCCGGTSQAASVIVALKGTAIAKYAGAVTLTQGVYVKPDPQNLGCVMPASSFADGPIIGVTIGQSSQTFGTVPISLRFG